MPPHRSMTRSPAYLFRPKAAAKNRFAPENGDLRPLRGLSCAPGPLSKDRVGPQFRVSDSMKVLLRSITFLMTGVAVAACSTDPPVPLKKEEMPQAFSAPITPSSQAWPTADWWTGFSSAELTQLETTAEQNNNDLAVAAARVLQARGG